MKLNTATAAAREYPAVTADTLPAAARTAAYIAVRTAVLGRPVKVSRAGKTVYNGALSGADPVALRLWQGFRGGLSAASDRADRAAAALDNATTASDRAAALDDLAAATGILASTALASDTDDCISAAALAIWEHMADNDGTDDGGAWLAGVRATHRHIYGERKAGGRRVRTTTDAAGNVLRTDAVRYTWQGHLWADVTARNENGDLVHDVVDVHNAIDDYTRRAGQSAAVSALLDAIDRDNKDLVPVLRLVARGWTWETIARRLHPSAVPVDGRRVSWDDLDDGQRAAAIRRHAHTLCNRVSRLRRRLPGILETMDPAQVADVLEMLQPSTRAALRAGK